MKTLLESIVNELKLSNASTGNKLDRNKTFGDLKPGDTVYYYDSMLLYNTNITYTVNDAVYFNIKMMNLGYTEEHPDKMEKENLDFKISVNQNGKRFTLFAPETASWFLVKSRRTKTVSLIALDEKVFNEIVEKYNLNIQTN